MLKALELVGFKSFADKTRFDFPDGITVVVGPNGSGKSNIVDAIKWVLGSQSAKSLRGEEMADVIFKGSAQGGRKPCNSAEATLILDNHERVLGVDSDEVHVSRRVYRSGETEYLINRQPCRLKDIKDLFRGTGVGVDAYSLIEQGKVDRMLQASAKDRRLIFEEAAGISRFKAKKVETERRLQRVETNLVRLKDIVDEVHGRLSSLKSQAVKAQQYREMTQRLEELRFQIGLDELQSFDLRREAGIKELNKIGIELQELEEEIVAAQSRLGLAELDFEHRQALRTEKQRAFQDQWEHAARLQANCGSLEQRVVELNSEREITLKRREGLAERVELSAEQIEARQSEFSRLEVERIEQDERLQAIVLEKQETERQIQSVSEGISKNQAQYDGLARLIREAESSFQAEQSKSDSFREKIEASKTILDECDQGLLLLQRERHHFEAERENKRKQVESAREGLQQADVLLKATLKEASLVQDESNGYQNKLHGLRERLILLQQLESDQEGLANGSKRLLQLAAEHQVAPWDTVRGLVADLIEIDVHLAPLIDVALGASVETVVLDDGQIIEMLKEGTLNLGGRVSMIRMDRLPGRRAGEKIQLDGLRGVLGRADRLVHTQEVYRPLVQFLLGTTWLVDSLATALDLSHLRGAGLRFVTAECEKVDPDGTLSIGSLQTTLGLVSRRSEMHAARDEIVRFERLTADSLQRLHELQSRIESERELQRQTELEVRLFEAELHAIESKIAHLDQRAIEINANIEKESISVSKFESQLEEAIERMESARQEGESAKENQRVLQEAIKQETDQLEKFASQRQAIEESLTNERISLARIEQQLEGMRGVLEQLNRDSHERQNAVNEADEAIQRTEFRIDEAQQKLSQIRIEEAELAEKMSALQSEAEDFAKQAEVAQESVKAAGKELELLVRKRDKLVEQRENRQTEAEGFANQRSQLIQRYQDDFDVDLLDQDRAAQIAPLENRSRADAEVGSLRASISTVGSVNMEALQELDELQERYDSLNHHYQDLVNAKENLLRIVERINLDSRKVFEETLEAIRKNFQDLYRRSFGGGSADLVLEQGEDILEAGVEIVATPPGKTALSNSLLSGGEKALTAVALIMSIFKYKPSPFCILDEVDAPFDEANIGRFVSVLTEFLHMTKFVVVSHSKKTMTAANTIYGVTMQESGVSRQVAVRFEEVDENGEILDLSKTNKAA